MAFSAVKYKLGKDEKRMGEEVTFVDMPCSVL